MIIAGLSYHPADMTRFEYNPPQDAILDFIHDRIRELQDAGTEAKYILVGRKAYGRICAAIAARFRRSEGVFETYQYLPIVVDPSREDTVCVLPAPSITAEDVSLHSIRD